MLGEKMIEFKSVNGGVTQYLSQQIVLTIELSEIIMIGHPKLYENTFFLTDLYVKKKWSLRRISNEMGCFKNTVRNNLIEAGFEVMEHSTDEYKGLEKKIKS